ncbi:hypothetical protein DFJ77DRAFT_327685 [Powellomyces hirtus]|nr:hypothetical protein DFJ77DRAFT_327685 [Powellomyces hirtus]
MDKLCVLASDLERRIEEHSEAAANRYRLAATAAAAAGAGGEDWEEEDEMGGAGGEKDRMDVEKAVDSSPPAAGGVEKESKVTEGSAETPSAAAKEESAAVADVAGGASSEALGSAAPNPCVEAAVDWTAASKDEAATGQLDAAVGKRKRSASPSPSDSASKHRRLTSPAPPPSDATVSAAAAAATSTGMRVTLDAPLLPRIDTLAALHPSALIASPPPAPTITPTMRSNRHYSMRLKTQLSNLESAVVRSETNRLLMRDEIDQVRLVRDEKDLKFKRIIAACLRCDVADVERLITPLVSEFEP